MNAYRRFSAGNVARQDRIALVDDAGRTVTFGELDRRTAQVAHALGTLGLRRGDRLAAQIDKSVAGLCLYLGCLRSGICFVPLNTAYRGGEVSYLLGDAEPGLVVVAPRLVEQLGSRQALTLDEEGAGSFAELLPGAPESFDDPELEDDALAVLVYTSGTTGRPKGAMVTHGNLVSNAEALRDEWRITEHDVLVHALPTFHVHGLFVALHPLLLAGARIRFQRRFDPPAVLDALADATVLMGVPTFYVRLLAEPGLTREATRGMRLFVSGSAPLLTDTFAAFGARTGHTILERYGMSETGMITSNPYEGERRAGTVGFPLRGAAVRVVDERGVTCPPGQPGGIEVRGPNVFAGYWRRPDRTREDFTDDGWFRTGDIGTWSADGYLSIVGRAKDLVISGGYNVYPKEIELLIDALPGVLESAVIGLPDPDFGEAVTAVVVPRDGARLAEAGIVAALLDRIAGYKVPRRVVIVDALPRNAMGKVQKNVLRETLST